MLERCNFIVEAVPVRWMWSRARRTRGCGVDETERDGEGRINEECDGRAKMGLEGCVVMTMS